MRSTYRKLIGAVAILMWLPIYSLFAVAAAVHILPNAGWLVQLSYYAVAGTIWIIPIGLAFPWMHREPS